MNKNTLNPPLSPLPGGLFISSLFEGVLGGGGGGGGGGGTRVQSGEAQVQEGWRSCT